MGLETGSDKMLKITKKGCTKDIIREKVEMMKSLGIDWRLFTIVGFPEETISDMIETKDFVLELDPYFVSLNSLSPLPGTHVYNSIPNITSEFSSSVNQLYPEYSFSNHVNSEEFKKLFVEITDIFEADNQKKIESSTS